MERFYKLGKAQADVEKALDQFWGANGYGPTAKELGNRLELKPQTVQGHLAKLMEAGRVVRMAEASASRAWITRAEADRRGWSPVDPAPPGGEAKGD